MHKPPTAALKVGNTLLAKRLKATLLPNVYSRQNKTCLYFFSVKALGNKKESVCLQSLNTRA